MNVQNLKLDQIHHVAYRCKGAKETVEFYTKMRNMGFVLAIAKDHVPSTHEPDPHIHLVPDAGNGNALAFFELPTKPEMGRDPNTPIWVRHIAFKEHLEAEGVDVLGVTDHAILHSIYFFDPNGHRVELACPDPKEEEVIKRLDAKELDKA